MGAQTVILVLGLATVAFAQSNSRCTTPNSESAKCISIYRCPPLLAAVRDRTPQVVKFLRASQCGYDQDPLVCCGSVGYYTNINTPAPTTVNRKPVVVDQQTASRLLPARGVCGSQLTNKILNGQATELDEFPWMALLQYRKNGKNAGFSCGGSLISNRYVLTAAHCVVGRIKTAVGDLFSVRLGEYNTDTETDCLVQDGFRDCAAPYQDVRVEEAIAHAEYQDGSTSRYNDIALVRMNRNVVFSEFIKPICLPTEGERSVSGEKLHVAGWGLTENNIYSPVKLKLQIPLFDQSRCASTFRRAGVNLADTQLCAGGEEKRDSCQGDSGGPLMKVFPTNSGLWYIEGVVSFGARCGTKDVPGIYTRVSEFVPWILENMRS